MTITIIITSKATKLILEVWVHNEVVLNNSLRHFFHYSSPICTLSELVSFLFLPIFGSSMWKSETLSSVMSL